MPIQHWSDRIWVVTLADEPALSDDLMAALMTSASAPSCPDLVLDLTAVNEVNSTNLGQLLRLRKSVISRDGTIRLTGPSDAAWAVFITTGLDKIFEFRPDVASALAELQMRKR